MNSKRVEHTMPRSKKFKKLVKAVTQFYEGQPVPPKWQEKYGKKYSKKEAESIAFAIAKKKGWRT